MSKAAEQAIKRRIAVSKIMAQPTSYRQRLNQIINLFPAHIRISL